MKTNEKIEFINKTLDILNKNVFKNKKYMLVMEKHGNKYCIIIKLKRGREIKMYGFNTYDDIISMITFMTFIFDKNNNL